LSGETSKGGKKKQTRLLKKDREVAGGKSKQKVYSREGGHLGKQKKTGSHKTEQPTRRTRPTDWINPSPTPGNLQWGRGEKSLGKSARRPGISWGPKKAKSTIAFPREGKKGKGWHKTILKRHGKGIKRKRRETGARNIRRTEGGGGKKRKRVQYSAPGYLVVDGGFS